jgi:hypothetical protein
MKKRPSQTDLAPDQQRYAPLALRAVRQAAGFKSASAAAESLGFADAKYRSHEAGSRRISLEDAKRYAAAFGTTVNDLIHPDRGFLERKLQSVRAGEREAHFQATNATAAASRRLRIARLARGFDSGALAARTFSLPVSTYLGHEGGKKNPFSTQSARLYATAFGVEVAWLVHGQLPTGLGREFDNHLQRIKDAEDVLDLRHLVSPYSPPRKPEMARLKAAVRARKAPRWTARAGDVLPEIELAEVRLHPLQDLRSKPSRYWPLPKGFVLNAFDSSPKEVVVFVREESRDRLFVNVLQTDHRREGEFLVLMGTEIHEVHGGHTLPVGAAVIGRILAKFSLLHVRHSPSSV